MNYNYIMNEITDLVIPASFIEKWQDLTDTIAQLINVPAGLIIRVVEKDIQVFISSNSKGNPYKPGDSEVLFNSGLYCETVIKSNSKLHVPDALADNIWKNNPDDKLNMISYLGLPLMNPNETPFGTICVLDNKENHYSELYLKIMKRFKEIIESDLKMIYMNQTLGEKNKKLTEFIAEIQQLRGLLRICAHCKKIKDDGTWVNIESFIESHTEAEFSHGLCEVCANELYGDKEWFTRDKLKHNLN